VELTEWNYFNALYLATVGYNYVEQIIRLYASRPQTICQVAEMVLMYYKSFIWCNYMQIVICCVNIGP